MITSKKCKAAPDFELMEGHGRELTFHYAMPEGDPVGVVFFISCFGLTDDYIHNWLEKAAAQFGLLAVSVEYHCFRSRPETGHLP